MFKHIYTGIIYNNRKEAVRIMGQSRYKKALANKEFIFNYTPTSNEAPITTNFS